MRKLATILVAVIAIGLITCKEDQSGQASEASQQRYVVFIKPANIAPFVSDTSFYFTNSKDQQASLRLTKKKDVKAIINDHHLAVDDSKIFVDVVVAFVTTMDSVKADSVRSDVRIQSVGLDVDIEGKPIQQGTPIILGKPIQQDQDGEEQDWGLKKIAGCWTSCAVKKAHGGVDGSGRPAVIWVVDTGIEAGPPTVGNPYLNIKTEWGVNFTGTTLSNNTDDDNGHGTMVAGVAAAKMITWDSSNKICAGVSPGAWVVPMKVLNANGSGQWSWIINALDHIIIQGRSKDVINLSLGDFPIANCTTEIVGLETTLKNAASVHFVVMASGNNLDNAARSLPGCIEGDNLFTVAAVSCGKQCAVYSNYGDPVDWAAVGTDVFTTHLYNPASGWQFVVSSGTSLSSAVISGVIHSSGEKPKPAGSVHCSVLGSTTPARAYFLGRR